MSMYHNFALRKYHIVCTDAPHVKMLHGGLPRPAGDCESQLTCMGFSTQTFKLNQDIKLACTNRTRIQRYLLNCNYLEVQVCLVVFEDVMPSMFPPFL